MQNSKAQASNVQRTSDEEAACGVEVEERLPAHALPVLDHVRLVQDEVAPLLAAEHLGVLRIKQGGLGRRASLHMRV